MRVAVMGLGSVWRRRLGKSDERERRIAHTVYYNTTGVVVNGQLRTRPRIVGHLRFNGISGLDPNHPSRAIHRVFECAEPCIWKGQNKLLFERLVHPPARPDFYLMVAGPETIGTMDVGSAEWRSSDSWVISFSEDGERQQAMMLMAEGSWIRTKIGMFVAEPEDRTPWLAQLRLCSEAR